MNNKDKKQLKALASQMPSVIQIGKEGLSDAVIDSARVAITASCGWNWRHCCAISCTLVPAVSAAT